jgi:serine protease Do
MKKIVPLFFIAFSILFFNTSIASANQLPDFTGIVENAKDSVVNISTSKTIRSNQLRKHLQIPQLPEGSPFGELFKKFLDPNGQGFPDQETNSLGSGFIISRDGYILTNHHVVDGADEVIVRLNNREEYEAKVIGSDKDSDVALIKIEGDDFPMLKFGDSNALKVGEWVLAIGSPFGFDHTVTAGIVSAKSRSLPSDNYVPFIQTDVAINPGNSGGPLFNMDGEVIGINSQIYSRSGGFMGLSFAIPIEMAVDVAMQIKDSGKVSRGWLGVLIQEVTRELAETFGMKAPHGALIAKVLDDSPAQQAGLQVGDVIVEFNGKKVTRSSSLPPLVGRTPVNKYADVTIIRDRKQKTIKVKIAQLPTDITQASAPIEKPEQVEKSALGMSVTPLDKATRDKLNLSSGVLVMDIDAQGPASNAGIRKGDVISMIDNHGVNTVAEFDEVVDGLQDQKSVAILIQRSSGPVFLAIKPDKS